MLLPTTNRGLLALIACVLLTPTIAQAQLKEDIPADEASRYGEPLVGRFRVGVELTGRGGVSKNLVAMVAVPLECDEQQLKIVGEDVSANISKVTYRDVKGGQARQMLIKVRKLAPGEKAWARLTFEVATRPTLPLEDEDAAKLSLPRKLPSSVRRFLTSSPYIESRNGKIRSLSSDILKEQPDDLNDYQRIEGLYDYVIDNIQYELQEEDTSALTTLREGYADCHGRSALFVGLCRAAGYPARLVWVDGHCYAEFYLEDEEGEGLWLPIESAGSRAFGEMPLARVILQKGDSFVIPERKRERLRYASDFVVAKGGNPRVKFIREQL